MNDLIKPIVTTYLTTLLLACGGGGSESDENIKKPTQPIQPSIVDGGNGYVIEDQKLTATGKLTHHNGSSQNFKAIDETGLYGRIMVDTNGTWKYSLSSELADPLNDGEIVVDQYNVNITNSTNIAKIEITITGTDDPYTFIPNAPLSTLIAGSDMSQSGTLVIQDVDGNTPGFVRNSVSTEYGDFTLNQNGKWDYSLKQNIQKIKPSGTHKDILSITLSDQSEHQLQFSIVIPATDATSILTGNEGSVTENEKVSTSGMLVDTKNPNQTFGPFNGWGKYGQLTVTTDGSWAYTLSEDLSNPLSENEIADDEFSVSVGTKGDTTTITIEISGQDDAYQFKPESPLATLIVTTKEAVKGTLIIRDVDGNTPDFIENTISGKHGEINLSRTGNWKYTLSSTSKALPKGTSTEDTLTIQLSNGTEHQITFSIVVTDPNANNTFDLSLEQKRKMLDTHNHYRKKCANGESGEGENAPKSAGNMQTLFWDNALAKMAKERAAACYFGHLGDATGIRDAFEKVKHEASFELPVSYEIGENISINILNPPATQYEDETWTGSVKSWYDESYAYDWDSNYCHTDTCGHWSQVCSGETRYVGCAVAECDNIKGSNNPAYNDGAHVIVCNYYPSVNKGELPFTDGWGYKTCRTCTNYDYPFCVDNMCAGGITTNWNQSEKRNKNINQCTDGLNRDIVPCTYGDHPPPPQVTGLKHRLSYNRVNLFWNETIESGGVNHYEIYRDGELIGETKQLTFQDTKTKQGVTYQYEVRAVDHSSQNGLFAALEVFVTPM